MLSHGYTPICQNLECLVKEQRRFCQTQIHIGKYNFDIGVKGQSHTEVMNVRDTSYHGDTLTCQTYVIMTNAKI